MSTHDNRPDPVPEVTDGMDDATFVAYLDARCPYAEKDEKEMPTVALFPDQMQRIMDLSGMRQSATLVALLPARVLQCDAKAIRECVAAAKARLA